MFDQDQKPQSDQPRPSDPGWLSWLIVAMCAVGVGWLCLELVRDWIRALKWY